MTRDELLDLYRRSGALLEGHFRLTSGLHSPGYLQCALVLQHPGEAEALGQGRWPELGDVRGPLDPARAEEAVTHVRPSVSSSPSGITCTGARVGTRARISSERKMFWAKPASSI